MLGDKVHHSAEPRIGAVAVLVVGRIDHRPSTETFQACLQHHRLRGVQHDRQGGGGRQPECNVPHVGGAVSADVVDVEVEHVRAVADLGARNVDTVVPALREQRLAKGFRPVGVGPFPDRQIADVLAERHVGVQRCRRRNMVRRAITRLAAFQTLDDLPEVLRSSATATTHQAESELANELFQSVRQLHRLQRVDRPCGRQLR